MTTKSMEIQRKCLNKSLLLLLDIILFVQFRYNFSFNLFLVLYFVRTKSLCWFRIQICWHRSGVSKRTKTFHLSNWKETCKQNIAKQWLVWNVSRRVVLTDDRNLNNCWLIAAAPCFVRQACHKQNFYLIIQCRFRNILPLLKNIKKTVTGPGFYRVQCFRRLFTISCTRFPPAIVLV